MATFAIGDIQGCHDELVELIGATGFSPKSDRLAFVGDLVNRGPQSLEVLRTVRDLGDRATVILGNHDLHLLALAQGAKRGKRDTLDAVLEAKDRDELLDWLARCPLAWRDPGTGTLLVHAGLPPQWTVLETLEHADEAAQVIASRKRNRFLARMYGDDPDRWHADLEGVERTRYIVNCLTRLRYCTSDGRLNLRPRPPFQCRQGDAGGGSGRLPIRRWFGARPHAVGHG
jgi:bis(5'-nucleosyl)-tetraphosphatase (symmetrical)